MKGLVLWILRAYKRFVSPWLPPSCRFEPTCSEYMYQAIEKKGVLKGFLLGGLAGGLSGNTQTNLSGILVDGKTGRVVWYNAVAILNRDPRKPSELMQTTQNLTTPLLGKSKISPDHSRDAVIIDKLKR